MMTSNALNPKLPAIAQLIDHTLLKVDATVQDILKLINEAKHYQFKSVCIHPTWVALAARELAGSSVEICTVIGFPLGATTPATKAFEAKNAIENGATEIDMVINIGALKSGNDAHVEADIIGVVQAAKQISQKIIVKVILETCLLTDEEKEKVCQICVTANADFVKTSTGFSTGGASIADIELMRKIVGPLMGVKASGGVRSFDDAQAMIKAGANRLGTSAGISIVTGIQSTSKVY